MNHKLLAAVAAAVLTTTFAGCASGAPSNTEPGASGSATAGGQSASASPAQATTEQYAELVDQFSGKLQQANQDAAVCATDAEGEACQTALLPVSNDAGFLANSLEWAQDPNTHYYVGEPPAEISDLVTKTLDQARTLEGEALAQSDQTLPALKTLSATLTEWSQHGVTASPTPKK